MCFSTLAVRLAVNEDKMSVFELEECLSGTIDEGIGGNRWIVTDE